MKKTARAGGRPPGAARYKQIAEAIESDIAAGRYPVGAVLPTEAELGERFDSGRHTVREALRLLTQGGLIERRAGSGSTVVRAGRRAAYVQAISNFDQWFNYPDGVLRRRLSQAALTADAALADSLGCEPGTLWLCISALRTLAPPAPPLCWVDIYVPQRFARVVKSRDIDARPVHEQVEAMFGVVIAEVEVRISAGRVPAAMAEALGVTPDSAALLLRRRYLSADGTLLQATLTVHPENRYAYEMRFRREGPERLA